MKKPSHPLLFVPLMLSSAFVLSACASQPPVPVVAKCPRFPEAPPSLMQAPQAPNALSELQQALATLADDAKPTQSP